MASSLNRLMSKRNSTGFRRKAAKISGELYSGDKSKKSLKGEDLSVIDITAKLEKIGLLEKEKPDEEAIRVALRSKFADGDADRALDLLILYKDASFGLIEDIRRDVKLLGAENNGKVTCYLDSLLFALYARLDSFEPMLCNDFEDENTKELATRIRLFVNMLRIGNLITSDLMQAIQDCLGKCGWAEGAKRAQQDASEAFSFIAEKLQMPLLTLKMDIAHGGKDTPDDDHKFINERLLCLAIPPGAKGSVTLEECLEEYFNNRVDVRRTLERRQTVDSLNSFDEKASIFMDDKPTTSTAHIEYADLGNDPETPLGTPSSPTSKTFSLLRTVSRENGVSRNGLRRQPSALRREIMIPAWQFFSILPFYTDNTASKETTRANFASHFSSKRPIIGLCLKRYSWDEKGFPVRNGIEVKIPLTIDLPHFVGDEDLENPGHFRLTLQSAVCHRGATTHSGHYIALVRDEQDKWLLFNDLAKERVIAVDQQKAFAEESPYLLFYQVEIIDDPPPLYEEAISGRSSLDTKRSNTSLGDSTSNSGTLPILSIQKSGSTGSEPATPVTEVPKDILDTITAKLERNTTEPIDAQAKSERLRPTSRLSGRRQSESLSKPVSRSGSRNNENRLSLNFSRLMGGKKKDDLFFSDVSDQENAETALSDKSEEIVKGKEKEKDKRKSRSRSKMKMQLNNDTGEEGTDKDKDCIIM